MYLASNLLPYCYDQYKEPDPYCDTVQETQVYVGPPNTDPKWTRIDSFVLYYWYLNLYRKQLQEKWGLFFFIKYFNMKITGVVKWGQCTLTFGDSG